MHAKATSRREFLRQVLAATAAGVCSRTLRASETAQPEVAAVDIGSRRELLVDDFLIASRQGVELKLHQPRPCAVALTCDAPWEGNTSGYFTLFQDGDRYRAYYRGWHFDERTKQPTHREFTCYAESRDGLTFEKPRLSLYEFAGSKANNIIWDGEGTHNFTPFKDENPGCSAEARYKALARGKTLVGGKNQACLHAYQSADGIHWSRMSAEAVLTAGAFDSQNLAFFDAGRGAYRAYWRIFTAAESPAVKSPAVKSPAAKSPGNSVRAIRTATSRDFLHWENQADLTYPDAPSEHLYTNAIRPYFRAPHLFIGFPTRFQPKNQQVEPVFMSSRDGVRFRRWSEALIPITAPQNRDGNRSNYMTWGLLELPGNERELSVYATEAYYAGTGGRVRRFAYRMDGFASAHAGAAGGSLVTKPLRFAGATLALNIVSQGNTRVELQNAAGQPLPGFGLEACLPITVDAIEHAVSWPGGDLSSLAGQAVRLRFELHNADLYSFRFKS